MPRLALQVLGTLSLTLDGQPLTAFKSDKGRALLVYLAMEAHRSHRRERLAGLLWPDYPNRAALARLSDTLSNLRNLLADPASTAPFLTVTSSTLQFNTHSDYSFDAREFERATTALLHAPLDALDSDIAGFEAAIAAYQGPFLEGFSLKDSAGFDEWALLKREQFAQRMALSLHRLATWQAGRGDYAAAQRHAQRLVQLEPLDEESYRVSMRILAAAGKRSAALSVYETCRRLVAKEFNVEPDGETLALCETIRSGRLPSVPQPRAGPPVSPPPVARSALPVSSAETDAAPAPEPRPVSPAAGAPPPLPWSHLVGREQELNCLVDYLAQAQAGRGRVVFVTGEAGSGKSALLAEFAARALAADPALIVAGGSCNALVGVGDPYLPFRDVLAMLGGNAGARRTARGAPPEQRRRLAALLPDFVAALSTYGPDLLDNFLPAAPLLACIKSLDSRPDGPYRDVVGRLTELVRARAATAAPAAASIALFEQYAGVLAALAATRPLLLIISDLQWADSRSLDLLFHLGRRLGDSRVLLAATYRPDEIALGREGSRHPLERVVNELESEFGDLHVALPAAPGRAFVDALLDAEPNELPESFRAALAARTGGHPLFTVEMLAGLHERGDLVRDAEGRWTVAPVLNWERLPSRIEAVLAERVERLPAEHRRLLEIASVEGEEFTAEIAAAVLAVGEDEVARRLNSLQRRQHLIVPVGLQQVGSRRLSRHRFTHEVLRQYLYSRLDPVDRARLHEAVGRTLAAMHGAAPEAAVQLAWHFEQAGLPNEAADYLLVAGEQAMRLSAHREAIRHFERGLSLLAALPESEERGRRETALRVPLAGALSAARGWGAPERSDALAGASAAGTDASRRAVMVLAAQSDVLLSQGEVAAATRTAEEAVARAVAVGDRQSILLATGSLGLTHYVAGDVNAARRHLEQALGLFDRAEDGPLVQVVGADAEVLALTWLAPALWILGYPDRARRTAARAIRIADELHHPATHATAVVQSLLWHALAHLPADYEADIAYLLRMTEEHALPTARAGAEFLRAWWTARQGRVEEGVAQMRACLDGMQAPGNTGRLPVVSVIFAEICVEHGLVAQGLAQVDAMLAWCGRGLGRLVEAELYRLRGALLPDEVEGCYRRSVEIARDQGVRAWELRSATSLARLWLQQRKPAEAQRLLAPVYESFDEGLDTPDLVAAASLLEERCGGWQAPAPAREEVTADPGQTG